MKHDDDISIGDAFRAMRRRGIDALIAHCKV